MLLLSKIYQISLYFFLSFPYHYTLSQHFPNVGSLIFRRSSEKYQVLAHASIQEIEIA